MASTGHDDHAADAGDDVTPVSPAVVNSVAAVNAIALRRNDFAFLFMSILLL
jgi:hypothetical protein